MPILICSLCGRLEDDVEHMFTGKRGVICADCVDICAETLAAIRRDRQLAENMAALNESLDVIDEGRACGVSS